MSNIFNSLKPSAKPSHNAFDKSRRDIFSGKVGMLIPCFVEDTIPEERLDVSNVNIIRTDSIQSTPFARMSVNTDYHFVPYSQIYHDFERLYYERGEQMRNQNNSAVPSQVSASLPRFSLYELVGELNYENFGYYFYSDLLACFKAHVFEGDITVVDILNSGNTITYDLKVTGLANFEKGLRDGLDLVLPITKDVFGRYCVQDVLRNLDLLGYGNYLPLSKTFYNDCKLKNRHLPSGFATYDDMILAVTVNVARSFNVLSDIQDILTSTALNYVQSIYDDLDSHTSVLPLHDYQPTILRIAAYLKVWSDFYRNSQYDVSVNYAYYFNFDYITASTTAIIPISKVIEALKPRYRQWKKDMFTGSYPTAQFGSVAVATINNPVEIVSQVTGVAVGSNVANIDPSGALTAEGRKLALRNSSTTSGTKFANSDKWSIDTGVSALAIRQAEAMQRYRERILRAGNRLTALQRAVFGDSSRYLDDTYSNFLNGFKQTIDFNSVSTTAEGNGRNVGELASNGVSTFGGRAFTYHSHDFGIVIGLTYILPESEYEAYGLDPFVTKSVGNDFFKPDFQNLGLSPVFDFNNYVFGYQNSVIGYLARYWEYKTAVDKVHGEFYNRSMLRAEIFGESLGVFANYVTPRAPHDFSQGLTLASLYVDPRSCDSIFYVASDESQATDQFKFNFNHQVTAVMPMSVTGLPSL